MQQSKTKRILFLGEQDGVGERELMAKLAECFGQGTTIEKAFLARVSFIEAPMPQVALCLRSGEHHKTALVECVGKIFSKLFKTTSHLDILFLSDTQVDEISQVAKPFYTA